MQAFINLIVFKGKAILLTLNAIIIEINSIILAYFPGAL